MTLRSFFAALAASLVSGLSSGQAFDAAGVVRQIEAGTTESIQAARTSILRYLGDPRLSVGDRLASAGALIQAVAGAVASEDEFTTVNGVLMAGSLVTPESMPIVTSALTDGRPGVRYAGCKALGDSLAIIGGQGSPSVQPDVARRALDQLTAAARDEQDPAVVECAFRAIAAATSMSASSMKPLEPVAAEALAALAEQRVGTLDALHGDAYTRTLGAVVYAAAESRRLLSESRPGDTAATRTAAATLGGEIIGHAYKVFAGQGSIAAIDEAHREHLAQAAAVGEALVFFAARALGKPAENTQIAEALRAGDDRAFRSQALRLIGPTGVLAGLGVTIDNAPTGG